MLNSRKIRFLISIIGLLLSAIILCDELFAYNLHDAVYQTLQNHPDILSTKAESAAAEQDIKVAQGGLYPSLDISAGIGRENSNNPATRATGAGTRVFTRREAEAFLQQLLFDGGNALGIVRQRRSQFEASIHRITEIEQRLAFAATNAYFDILRLREIVAIRKLDVSAHRDLVTKVKRRLVAGAGRKSEISLAKARLALSISRLEGSQGELENAYDTFNKIVGQPAPRLLKNPGLPRKMPRTEAEARSIGLQANPSIKATESDASAAYEAIGIAQSTFYPRFTLDFSATYNNNLDGVTGRNEDKLAMLRMTYNILNGWSDLANIRAARNRERASVEDVANIKRDVIEDISLSWNDLQADKERLPYLKQHRDESLEVFNAYVKQFQLGQRTLFDLLNAQAEYYDASINYITGRYDIRIESYRLLASMGTLVSMLSQGNYAIERAAERSFNYLTPERKSARYAGSSQIKENPEKANKQTDVMLAENAKAKAQKTMATSQEITAIMGDQDEGSKAKVQKTTTSAEKVTAINDGQKKYTIQLFAAANKEAASRFIHNNHLENEARVVEARVSGKMVYRVYDGQFTNQTSAYQALDQLPSAVQALHPIVKIG